MRGLWKASYTWLITVSYVRGFHIYESLLQVHTDGWVEVDAADIRSVITLGAYEKDQRPQLEVFNCSVALGQVDLQIGGGVIPWIVNLFRADLSATIKQVIHEQVHIRELTALHPTV